jgi:osmoprotectant transport system ATP-binding protein
MLRVDNITKTFGGQRVLDAIELSVDAARTTILIGPSGCGKSTLLRIMIGLLWPDSGQIVFDSVPLTLSNALSIRQRTGYVIQDGGLFPHLTARENIVLMARHLGWPAARVESRLAELAKLTQFPNDGLQRYPAQLSGGQKQRVAVMRALFLNPDVILLDEPLGALDPMIRAELQADLKLIFQELKKTVVMVTHDIGEAAFFGDSIVLMRDGTIVQQGRVYDFIHSPADPFVTRFINAQRTLVQALPEGVS